MIVHRCACEKSQISIIITFITQASLKYQLQELGTFLAPQNLTQGRCDKYLAFLTDRSFAERIGWPLGIQGFKGARIVEKIIIIYILTSTENLVVYRDNSQASHSTRKSCIHFPGGFSMYQDFGGDSELIVFTVTTSYQVYLNYMVLLWLNCIRYD